MAVNGNVVSGEGQLPKRTWIHISAWSLIVGGIVMISYGFLTIGTDRLGEIELEACSRHLSLLDSMLSCQSVCSHLVGPFIAQDQRAIGACTLHTI